MTFSHAPAAAGRLPRRLRTLLAAACAALAIALLGASPAQAAFGIRPGSFRVELSDSQAAGHPNITTKFEFNGESTGQPFEQYMPDGLVKDIVVDVPPGLIGNPQAMPQCRPSQISMNGNTVCPVSTQVGVATLKTAAFPVIQAPVYNMVPAQGEVAQFAFMAVVFQIQVTASIRSDGDFGLRMTIPDTPTTAPLWSSELTFWGVPDSPVNDRDRGKQCLDFGGGAGNCFYQGEPYPVDGVPAQATPRPFTNAPATCGAQTTARMRANSWGDPSRWDVAETTVAPFTGCERMTFAPQVKAQPTTTRAGAPTGLAVDIDVPQNDAATGVGTPPLKKAVVRLPEGMAVSPSAANGLGACSDEQVAIGSLSRPACPQSSIIGTASIASPLQAEPMTGSIYLGTQTPSRLLRIFLHVEGGGVQLKLPGVIDADPVTGQLTTTFDDQPMLAASKISLRFSDGPRAVLSNPATCGVKTTTSEISSYGGIVGTPSDSFTITQDGAGAPCPPPAFGPSFEAGTTDPVAGKASAFTLTFGRGDGDQALRAIDLQLPEGLTGRVADLDALCPAVQAAAGTCAETSRIGSAQVAAGPGSAPYWLPGRVYMTEGHGGGAFGLAIVVPAKAGPLDLGTVVVRTAVHVDKRTAALRIVSDPIPTILQGIPLQIRTINVTVDRPGFMLNPTSCAPLRIGASIGGGADMAAARESRFQVGDCGSLRYKPALRLKVGGKGRTGAGARPSLTAVLTQPAGQANNDDVTVTLPRTINARLDIVSRACTQEAYDAGRCGDGAKLGTASVVTPILRDPLAGPVYFVRTPGRSIPSLVVQLRGQVDVDLVGLVSVSRSQQLVTSFQGIPDIPVSRFRLSLRAGGVVGNVANMCTARARRSTGKLVMRGQNGVVNRSAPRVAIAGCGKKAKKANARKGAAARR